MFADELLVWVACPALFNVVDSNCDRGVVVGITVGLVELVFTTE